MPVARVTHRGAIHLGLDVHKDSISVGLLNPAQEAPDVERIFNDEASIPRADRALWEPGRLRACCEVGPTGSDRARLLKSLGVSCEVIAPSMIPKAPGDR